MAKQIGWSFPYKCKPLESGYTGLMNWSGSIKLALCAASMIAVSACMHTPDNGANVAAQSSPASDRATPPATQRTLPRATRIAQTMAEAEAAYATGQSERLTTLVSALHASGLKPYDDAGDDVVAMWAAAASGDSVVYRGRLLGPAYVRGELGPGEVWRSAQTFKSGELSTLAVSHEGSGPVRLKVSDASSRSICEPTATSEPTCRFTPLYTQRYEIELVNKGSERAVYFLVFD